jgi:hypothetical protein
MQRPCRAIPVESSGARRGKWEYRLSVASGLNSPHKEPKEYE